MRLGITILLVVLVGVTGALIVRAGLRSDREPPKERTPVAQLAPVAAAPSCSPVITTETLDTRALQAAIRQIVREEVRAAQDSEQAEACRTGAPRAAAPVAPTVDSVDALRQTRGLVLNALSTRYWGAEQAMAMSELLPRLTPDQRAEVFKELVPAINNGDVVVATEGSPF